MNIPILKVRNKQVVRFHGMLSSAPTTDVELGDIYIRSSDKRVFACNDINNNGVPQWVALN